MSSRFISAIRAKIDDFPVLPAVAARLLEITADPESTTDHLLEVISMDPSLSAVILKLSNSAFFGCMMTVTSLKQAVQVLGWSEIRNLVLLKAVFNNFKHLKKKDRFDIRRFWEHSFLCGLAAKIIAADLGAESSEFFIAGLIHDIGELIIYMQLPEEYHRIIEARKNPLATLPEETKILGITHPKVGMMLFKKWMFPDSLVSAVGFHHQPWEATEHADFPIVIHAADLLALPIEITGEEAADSDLIRTFIYPAAIRFFESHGITWNAAALRNYKDRLEIQKAEKAGALGILLS